MPYCSSCERSSILGICPYCLTELYPEDRHCPVCLRRALPACPKCRTPYSYRDYGAVPSRRQQGGCFIATAAYGTPMSEEINILRRWRDNVLTTSSFGLKLISIYYRISPCIANQISKSNILRTLTRFLLLPIVSSIKKFHKYKRKL